MTVCLICADGFADNRRLSILRRWGIGCTVAYYRNDDTSEAPLHVYDDSLSGWNHRSQRAVSRHGDGYINVPIIESKNDVGTIETLALARAFWLAAHLGSDDVEVVIACDRMASIRTLEKYEGCAITGGRFAFAYALRRLRVEIIRALKKHSSIDIYYMKEKGFTKKWRPDVLSRSGVNDNILPVEAGDLLQFRINYDTDNGRRSNFTKAQFVYQKLSLLTRN